MAVFLKAAFLRESMFEEKSLYLTGKNTTSGENLPSLSEGSAGLRLDFFVYTKKESSRRRETSAQLMGMFDAKIRMVLARCQR